MLQRTPNPPHRKPLSAPPYIQILKTRTKLEFKKIGEVQVIIGGV